MIFKNREEAGTKLTDKLKKYKNKTNTIVIGLPRGGVVVAYQIAKKLNLPLDIIVPRKIGAPNNPELAIGAITQDGQIILDQSIIDMLKISKKYINKEAEKEKKEAKRRLKLYRDNKKPLNIKNKTIIIVDDGIATGSTIKAAIKSVKENNAKKIILAIPVAPFDIVSKLKKDVDEIICIEKPTSFYGISQFYNTFTQTEDKQVIELIKKSKIKKE